jgi:hypothetical protein
MPASFSSTAYDSFPVLPVTKQTSLVTNPISQVAGQFDPATIGTSVRKNPRNILDVMGRVETTKKDAPLIGMAALVKPLQLDSLCAQHSGENAYRDRLGRGINDRGLIGAMCAEELLNLAKLMQGRKKGNILEYANKQGVIKRYFGGSHQYATVSAVSDVLTATKPGHNQSHKDMATKLGFGAMMIAGASKFKATDVIKDRISDSDSPYESSFLKRSALQNALKNADHKTIQELIVDPSMNLPGASVESNYPGWKGDLTGNFKFDEFTPPNDVPSIRNDFKTTMSSANPSSAPWHWTPDDDGIIPENGPDLGLVQKMSPDARTMFKADPDLGIPNAVADNYPPMTLPKLTANRAPFSF